MPLQSWLSTAKKITPNSQNGKSILKVFCAALEWIYTTKYAGGCHDTSAAIYILLCELGLTPVLCIGEVKYGKSFFDHSWVELNNKIFDAAVFLPEAAGKSSPPVFASIDLTTGKKTQLIYGLASPDGYCENAKLVAPLTLGEYSKLTIENPDKLWKLTKSLGKEAGMKVNIAKIREKYSHVQRQEKHDGAISAPL